MITPNRGFALIAWNANDIAASNVAVLVERLGSTTSGRPRRNAAVGAADFAGNPSEPGRPVTCHPSLERAAPAARVSQS